MTDSSSVSVPALLKKTEHYDKDERYMATSDLCEVLKRQQPLEQERQICTAVLRLLHDKSNDVQAIAVKTLSVLLTTVQQEQVLEIADSLADQVLDASKSELRDVYAIGLRTLVKTIPANMGDRVSQRLAGRLLDGIRSNDDEEIVLACLDILTDVLQRFGATAVSVTRQHEPLLQLLLSQLQTQQPRPVVRKRAGNTLAVLSTVLADHLLHRLVESLLQQMDMLPQHAASTRALIRTLCTVSGAVGHRLGQAQIDRMVPLFLEFTQPSQAYTGDDEDLPDDDDEDEETIQLQTELRESCFMGFESFVKRCPKQVEPHLTPILQAALAYMSYDPNYSYGDDDDDEMKMESEDDEMETEDEDEYDEEDDEEEDDDDESWKVRRSAIRALKAIVQAKTHDAEWLWRDALEIRPGQAQQTVAAAILSRFKEREENCRVELMECFTDLLRLATATTTSTMSTATTTMTTTLQQAPQTLQTPFLPAPQIVLACERILDIRKGHERSKSGALALLAVVCQAPGGIGNAEALTSVIRHVQVFLAEQQDKDEEEKQQQHKKSSHHHHTTTSKALRLDALTLVHAMLASEQHAPADLTAALTNTTLLPQLCLAVQEQWYKVIAEALRALAQIPRLVHTAQVATMVYTAVEPLLATHDVDQEIKECALKASAALQTNLHSLLQTDQCDRLWQLLLDRLQNETTRIPAMKTLAHIEPRPAHVLEQAVPIMAGFLKCSSRTLQLAALETLNVVLLEECANPAVVLQDLAPLLGRSDNHLRHLSLNATVSILKVCPGAGPLVKEHVLEHVLNLSTKAEGVALGALLALLQQMVERKAVEFQELLSLLRAQTTTSKTHVYNLAECIAMICFATSQENAQGVLEEYLQQLLPTQKAGDIRPVQLALLITGNLGRRVDLTTFGNDIAERLRKSYVHYLASKDSDDWSHAAAYALGNASVGCPGVFLQEIVTSIRANPDQPYLVLSALREFIKCGAQQTDSLPLIFPPLEQHCGDDEEGVRTMVAECLGSLACLQPAEMFGKLEMIVKSHAAGINAPGGFLADGDSASQQNARVCWTVATSIKLAIAGKVEASHLAGSMPTFVALLQQEELSVRNAALLMVYSAAHHMPQVLAPLLSEAILPQLFAVAKLKLERKVDLGPFTHTVDDALPLRKAALSIFATCMDNLPGSIDITSFLPVLAKSLGDAEDIQLHAHQIVISMCSKHPVYLVSSLDSFVEPLEKTMNKKQGQKTGTELERLNDWIRSALRVMLALSKLDGAMNSRKFADFCERIQNNSKFTEKLRALEEER